MALHFEEVGDGVKYYLEHKILGSLVAARMKTYRELKELKQIDLCRLFGCNQSCVSKYEKGRLPEIKQIITLRVNDPEAYRFIFEGIL